jgi:hypothetical protein
MIPIAIGTVKYLYGSASRIVGFKKFFICGQLLYLNVYQGILFLSKILAYQVGLPLPARDLLLGHGLPIILQGFFEPCRYQAMIGCLLYKKKTIVIGLI